MLAVRIKMALIVLLLALLFTSSIGRVRVSRTCMEPTPRRYVHHNGLELSASTSQFIVETTEHGFDVSLLGEAPRDLSYDVRLELQPEPAPAGDFRQSRMVGGRRFFYRYTKASEYPSDGVTLQAFTRIQDKVMALNAMIASPFVAEADFVSAWCLLDGAHLSQVR